MEHVKTHRELYGTNPAIPYEWDAGNAPPWCIFQGRWTVRLCQEHWELCFHYFDAYPDKVLGIFPRNDYGERVAKKRALRLVYEAWER